MFVYSTSGAVPGQIAVDQNRRENSEYQFSLALPATPRFWADARVLSRFAAVKVGCYCNVYESCLESNKYEVGA